MTLREQIDEKVLNGYIAPAMEKQEPLGFRVGPEIHEQARFDNTSPDLVTRMDAVRPADDRRDGIRQSGGR